MRILDRSRVDLDFEKLGFSRKAYCGSSGADGAAQRHHPGYRTDRQLQDDDALHCVEGPQQLRPLLFTVEDPIEYQLAGINQVQVQPAIGLDFPRRKYR